MSSLISKMNNNGSAVVNYLTAINPFSNVYGLARSLLALGTFLTVASSSTEILFRPAVGVEEFPIRQGLAGTISIFSLFPQKLVIAKWISLAILALVISGWRPRFTGILHWWVSYSFMSSAILVDGGDQVTAILCLMLIPVTLMDDRKWHWDSSTVTHVSSKNIYKLLVANSTIKIIRLQIAVIYLHSAVAKCVVPEWENGTALYYWFTDPMFGAPDWLRPLIMKIVLNSFSVTILTWSIIVLEFALFAGLLAKRKYRSVLLVSGIGFHLGIALIHGLVSFALAMFAALIIFLRPVELSFAFKFKWFRMPTIFKPVQINMEIKEYHNYPGKTMRS